VAADPPLSAVQTRWAGRSDFTVLDAGFGQGRNFLATWQAWRDDAARPDRLHYIGLTDRPVAPLDLAPDRLDWPPPLAGWHMLDLEHGRVQLTLVVGPAHQTLKALDATADALFVDGAGSDDPRLLQALARHAAPGATLASGGPFAQAPGVRRVPPRGPVVPGQAVVIGAGLAGGWAAHALQQQGWSVTVLDRHAAPAQEASGNAAGLFHGSVNADDGPHARLQRAAALDAERTLRPWITQGLVPGRIAGLLRLASQGEDLAQLQALITRHALPPAYVQALDAAQASALAGIGLPRPAWFYPGGGWVAPAALVRHLLRHTRFQGGSAVARLQRDGALWRLFDADDLLLAQTGTLVLANSSDALRLWPAGGWPMGRSRGQISHWPQPPADAPRPAVPVAGGGYLLSLTDGGLMCGATAAPGDEHPGLREADHRFNLDRLQQMTGWSAAVPPEMPMEGRVGWRANTLDRLPLVGPAQRAGVGAQTSAVTRLRDVPREPGLFVLSGLGARGLTWGPLLGRVLAAWISGAAMPVPAGLRDALDPARWQVRAARRGSPGPADQG
jgi:tRNA 5-methylaminomethyl-2-thiouridine biosynthesis bifunctional protein